MNSRVDHRSSRSSGSAAVAASGFDASQRRQILWITAVAIVAFCALRWLPTGSDLSHMDFRVDAKNAIEFCDPLSPQFIPVVAVASPIAMSVSAPSAEAGKQVRAVVTLKTASGKPITTEDLLVVHTKRLHLLVVDPSLQDYQHVHPDPTGAPGEWSFEFTPRFGGLYRVFADFTPVATNRGLYADAKIDVTGTSPEAGPQRVDSATVEQDGFRFELVSAGPMRARMPNDLRFVVTRPDGQRVPLEPVMDAFAHLVAFDESRSGFAHLHPIEIDPQARPDAVRPTLNFKITIPNAGRYVIWAQVNLGGRETFVPFWFDVAA